MLAALALALLAQTQLPDGFQESTGLKSTAISGIAVDGGFAAGWQTALDCNFSTAPLQLLNTDAGYTVCGVTLTAIFQGAALTGGVASAIDGGLIVWPKSTCGASTCWTGANYNTFGSFPQFQIQLSSVIPGFTQDTPIAVWIWEQSSCAASGTNQGTIFGVAASFVARPQGVLPSDYWAYGFSRLSQATSIPVWTSNAFRMTAADTLTKLGSATVGSNDNVAKLVFPAGVGGGFMRVFYTGIYASGFPSDLTYRGQAAGAAVTPVIDDPDAGTNITDWYVTVGGENGAATSCSVNIGRVRIDYKN